jgi:hypothetical protein
MLLIKNESFFLFFYYPGFLFFNHAFAGLLILLLADIWTIGVLCDLPLLLHSSLSGIGVLLCSY